MTMTVARQRAAWRRRVRQSVLRRSRPKRISSDAGTRTYVARRLDEGLSRPEIIRILKRYVARETYRHLPR